MRIIFALIILISSCPASTIVIDPNQWQTIQDDVDEFKFMAKILCIIATVIWGAVTWRLILIAKNSNKFW